jgi:predicted esterase
VGVSDPQALIVLHGYEDQPGRGPVLADGDPRWQVLEPRGPVELPGGPAWFASDDDGPIEAQLETSVRVVQALVADAADRPVLGGFSQGGAIALAAALATAAALEVEDPPAETGTPAPAGLFCVNGWLPHSTRLDLDAGRLVSAGTRVLVVASIDDQVVAVQQGRSAARWLERAGVDVSLVELDGDHRVGPDALAAVRSWLDKLA